MLAIVEDCFEEIRLNLRVRGIKGIGGIREIRLGVAVTYVLQIFVSELYEIIAPVSLVYAIGDADEVFILVNKFDAIAAIVICSFW